MIQFFKDIPEDRLLMAYNNQVVLFKSDSALPILNCTVTGLGINATIYARPDGLFRFNIAEYAATEINTNRFADTLDSDLISGDATSFVYDTENGCYLQGDITFQINFVNTTNESASRNLKFISGVQQVEDFQRDTLQLQDLVILSPTQNRASDTFNLKYWQGYPFAFSFYNELESFVLENNTNGLDFEFPSPGKVTTLVLSDGRTDTTLEDFVPLVDGFNNLQIGTTNINITKMPADCGHYFKFVNKYGKISYWLFSDQSYRSLTSRYIDELNSDFDNLEDTISPTLQTGKATTASISCSAKRLTENDKTILDQIINSPKIYYFTGERFSRSNSKNWIEVTLRTPSIATNIPNTKLYNYVLQFDLPQLYSQYL